MQVSPSINDFAKLLELSATEERRLAYVITALSNGKWDKLPFFLANSASHDLKTFASQLIESNFLQVDN
jgi:hypothetical protein